MGGPQIWETQPPQLQNMETQWSNESRDLHQRQDMFQRNPVNWQQQQEIAHSLNRFEPINEQRNEFGTSNRNTESLGSDQGFHREREFGRNRRGNPPDAEPEDTKFGRNSRHFGADQYRGSDSNFGNIDPEQDHNDDKFGRGKTSEWQFSAESKDNRRTNRFAENQAVRGVDNTQLPVQFKQFGRNLDDKMQELGQNNSFPIDVGNFSDEPRFGAGPSVSGKVTINNHHFMREGFKRI